MLLRLTLVLAAPWDAAAALVSTPSLPAHSIASRAVVNGASWRRWRLRLTDAVGILAW